MQIVKSTIVMFFVLVVIAPFSNCANPQGYYKCGGAIGNPGACWRYCKGESGNWCFTDPGLTCKGSSVGNPQGNCKGKKCYYSAAVNWGLVNSC